MPKKVLILNGSPKGNNSSTFKATKAFVEGIILADSSYEAEYVWINDLNIKPCLGCLSCWGRTPGECVIKNDDASVMIKKIIECDIFIESYPLYFLVCLAQ